MYKSFTVFGGIKKLFLVDKCEFSSLELSIKLFLLVVTIVSVLTTGVIFTVGIFVKFKFRRTFFLLWDSFTHVFVSAQKKNIIKDI